MADLLKSLFPMYLKPSVIYISVSLEPKHIDLLTNRKYNVNTILEWFFIRKGVIKNARRRFS